MLASEVIKERPRSKLEAKKTSSQTSYQQKQHLRQAKRQSNLSVVNDTSNGATASQAILNNQDLLRVNSGNNSQLAVRPSAALIGSSKQSNSSSGVCIIGHSVPGERLEKRYERTSQYNSATNVGGAATSSGKMVSDTLQHHNQH